MISIFQSRQITGAISAAVLLILPHQAGVAQETPAQSSPAPAAMGVDIKPGEIVVASWGGAYAHSQERAYFSPFKTDSGITVRFVNHEGKGEAGIRGSGAGWDVVDMSAGAVEKACREGLLVKIDASSLPAADDGTEAAKDFLPGALRECGVGSVAWASAIAFDKRKFNKSAPERAADLFDTKKFPGKRGLPKSPKYLFEVALISAGVPAEEIYTRLGTDTGVDKALSELDKIKSDIVWWERTSEPLKLLSDGEVGMAIAFNGRIFASIVGDNQPFGVIWDGQVYDMDMWAIPKSSGRADAAVKFIAFASRPDRLAAQTRWFPYGPLRKSSLAMVGKHAEIDVDMAGFLPTSPDNFRSAVAFNAQFWSENEARITKRLEEWRTATAEGVATKTDGGGADSTPE